MMAVLKVLNGAFLGLMIPIVQSIVAEESEVKHRGYNFGWIDLCNKGIGQVVATLAVTSVSNLILFGMEGWRVAFMAVGILSLILAAAIALLMEEKPRPWTPENISILLEFKKFVAYFNIPTFSVICVQGMFGTIPVAAMSFATMYFQYRGLLDYQAAIVICMFHLGGGIGSLLGGVIGDTLNVYSRNHGRPWTAQISVLLGIPIVYAAFTVEPPPSMAMRSLASLVFMLGTLSQWCAAGCNKPIFLEIVSKDSQASAMAWNYCLEHTCGHLIGPMAVGFISERFFSYTVTQEQVTSMPPAMRQHNADSLGNSIAISTALPWTICFFLYGLLHFTYRQDKKNASSCAEDSDDDYSTDAKVSERTKLIC
jgi:predicted MFS family arabinose efflux permease